MEHGQYWPASANILVWQLCLWILLLGPHHHHWSIPHRKIHCLAARPQEKCYRSYTVAACSCTCTNLASSGFPPSCFCHPKENIIIIVVVVLLLLLWLWLLLNNLTFSGKVSQWSWGALQITMDTFQREVRLHFYDTNSDIDLLWPPHTTLVLNQTGNNPKASRVHMGCYKEHPRRPQRLPLPAVSLLSR